MTSKTMSREGSGRWSTHTDNVMSMLCCLLFLCSIASTGTSQTVQTQSFPEILRVRVPTDALASWLEKGEGLRSLPLDQFEALVESARQGHAKSNSGSESAVLRAEHWVRWEEQEGILRGRSRFLIELAPRFDRVSLRLSPWSPAVDSSGSIPGQVASLPDGSLLLRFSPEARPGARVDQARSAWIEVGWRQVAVPGSSGGVFALALPDVDASVIHLDLPKGNVPTVSFGARSDPEVMPEDGGSRWSWRFEGKPGKFDLRVRGQSSMPGMSSLWVSGDTDLKLDLGSGQWRTEWKVWPSLAVDRVTTMLVDLDPGLEWTDLQGENISGGELRPGVDGGPSELSIHWKGGFERPTQVVLSGVLRLPQVGEGSWAIPVPRPRDATWSGGRVRIQVGSTWAVADCEEINGRLTSASVRDVELASSKFVLSESQSGALRSSVVGPLDPGKGVTIPQSTRGAGSLLVFDLATSGTPARIELKRAMPKAWAKVRGDLRLDQGSRRLDATVTVTGGQGVLTELALELPRSWSVDRIRNAAGLDLRWVSQPRPDGGQRLFVALSEPVEGPGKVTELRVEAGVKAEERQSGSLELPRVLPVGVLLEDEVWVGWLPDGFSLRPLEATGLAWLDGSVLSRTRPPGAGLTAGLGWRWLSEDGRGVVELQLPTSLYKGSICEQITLKKNRAFFDWLVEVESPGQDFEELAVSLSPAITTLDWRLISGGKNENVLAEPINSEEMLARGLPRGGSGWLVRFRERIPSPIRLKISADSGWSGKGELPVLALPGTVRARGLVLISADRNLRTELEASLGYMTLATSPLSNSLAATQEPLSLLDPNPHRLAHALSHEGFPGPLFLKSETLGQLQGEGAIREALLTTVAFGGNRLRQRLILDVVSSGSSTISIRLPAGSRVERFYRNAKHHAPAAEGTLLLVELEAGLPGGRDLIQIDYTQPWISPTGRERSLSPGQPEFSLPCLAMSWHLFMPRPWQVERVHQGLISTSPEKVWWQRLSFVEAIPSLLMNDGSEGAAKMLAQFALRRTSGETRSEAGTGEILTLGEWLSRWDRGPRPLLIDRIAFASLGLEPSISFPLPVHVDKADELTGTLRRLGLRAVEGESGILLTARGSGPRWTASSWNPLDGADSWARRIQEAAAWGSDRSDRIQRVSRWSMEPTSTGPGRTQEQQVALGMLRSPSPSWFQADLGATSWPVSDAEVIVIDGRFWVVVGAMAGLLVLTLGRALGHRLRLLGTIGWVTGVGVSTAAVVWGGGRIGPTGLGVLGSLITLGLNHMLCRKTSAEESSEASTVIRARRSPMPPSAVSNLGAGILLAALSMAGLGVSATGLAGMRLDADPSRAQETKGQDGGQEEANWPPKESVETGAQPILAFLPFDEENESRVNPRSVVWLRSDDHRRLESLAARLSQPSDKTIVAATQARHVVRVEDDRFLHIESRYELLLEGVAASWSIPTGLGLGLTAVLDGRAVPALMLPDGKNAAVEVSGPGLHQLVVRRRYPRSRGDVGERLEMPVTPVARSDVLVEGALDAFGFLLIAPTARGPRMDVGRESGLTGFELGPTDRLELSWQAEGSEGQVDGPTEVDALLLWSAGPAGDRLQARLTIAGQKPIRGLSLRLDPGVVVRSIDIPSTNGGQQGRPSGQADQAGRWIFRFDRPLQAGTIVNAEFWRPATVNDPKTSPRHAPGFQITGCERLTGLIALEKPASWLGRLTPLPGTSEATEDDFERSWGPWSLGEDRVPAGVTRLDGRAAAAGTGIVSASLTPSAEKIVVAPVLRLDLVPGRWEWLLEADLGKPEGHYVAKTRIRLPAELRLSSVEGEGLTHWDFEEPGLLRLRFDGPNGLARQVRLKGWIPVSGDPMSPDVASNRIPVPWPTWPDADVPLGAVTISAPTRAVLEWEEGGSIRTLRVEGPSRDEDPGRSQFESFTIGRNNAGYLRWFIGPSLSVAIDSQLVLGPDRAEWEARLNYQIIGAPVMEIPLGLSPQWSERARFEVVGLGTIEPSVEGRKITLRPKSSLWNRFEVVIRSSRPRSEDDSIDFPDLTPLGKGSVRDYWLSLINAVGRELVVESTGLDPGKTPSNSRILPPGATKTDYRVRPPGVGWALTAKPSTPEMEPSQTTLSVAPGDGGHESRVLWTEIIAVLGRDGRLSGLSRYAIIPGSGSHLLIRAADKVKPLAGLSSGQPITPCLVDTNTWALPVDAESSEQVELLWESRPETRNPRGNITLDLPGLYQESIPALVTIHAEPGSRLELAGGEGIKQRSPAYLEAMRLGFFVERMARSLVTNPPGMNPDGHIRRTGVQPLKNQAAIEFAEDARDAERALKATPALAQSPTIAEEVEEGLALVEDARRRIVEILGKETTEKAQALSSLEGGKRQTGLFVRRIGIPYGFQIGSMKRGYLLRLTKTENSMNLSHH